MLLCLQLGFWWAGLFSAGSFLTLLQLHAGFKLPSRFCLWWGKTSSKIIKKKAILSPALNREFILNRLQFQRNYYCFHFHMLLQFILSTFPSLGISPVSITKDVSLSLFRSLVEKGKFISSSSGNDNKSLLLIKNKGKRRGIIFLPYSLICCSERMEMPSFLSL